MGSGGEEHYTCGEKLKDGTVCSACYSGKGSIQLHMTHIHKKKLSKSSFMRKPDDQLTYQTFQEYQKQIKDKTQDLGTYTIQ